ncbi:hypothetical protein [Allokutzneria oryzae]|uniref:YCII-related domain-containing protein n=1 Tax=Allokutzneria oryzae TaxID=1378989 RepID=A0ABV5ZX27_9PSEU
MEYFVVTVEGAQQIAESGELLREWHGHQLYELLVYAGYPLTRGDIEVDGIEVGGCADWFDLAVDPVTAEVVAHTHGAEPKAHHLGDAGRVLLDWYLREVDAC